MKNISLVDSMRLQGSAVTNRAAALFPIFDIKKCDLLFVFDDYWRWKRNIDVEYRISVRTRCGALVLQTQCSKPGLVNVISLRKLIPPSIVDSLCEGTAEIEIFSASNLVFSFPAILGYYVSSTGHASVVHSCGRTLKNSNETFSQYFSEGNFYLHCGSRFKPFIHLFNGPIGALSGIQLMLDVFADNQVHTTTYKLNDLIQPYESRLIFIDEVIGKEKMQELSEMSSVDCSLGLPVPIAVARIQGKAKSIFPRWVCGNYDTVNNYPIVAHTFREVTNPEDTLEVKALGEASKMIIPGYPDFLSLQSAIYPYSSPSCFCVGLNVTDLGFPGSGLDYEIDVSRTSGRIFSYKQEVGDPFPKLFHISPLSGAKSIPARITINHSFFFPGNPCSFTDIALGFTPSIAPAKRNYWFTFLVLPEWSIFLLVSCSTRDAQCDVPAHFVLSLSCQAISEDLPGEFILERDFWIDPLEAASAIDLRQIIGESRVFPSEQYVLGIACRIKVLNGELNDVYALGANKALESVFGEHFF